MIRTNSILPFALALPLLLLSPLTHATELPEGALTTSLAGPTFTATLAEGYHFNEKAPNSVTLDGKKHKPTSIEKRKAVFGGLSTGFGEGRASVYVCDDAVTFCEPRHIALKGSGSQKASAGAADTALVPEKSSKPNRFGFLENDYKAALEQARKSGKLLLIDFSARWCPGCVRLESEVLGTSEFRAMTQNYIKLKVDVDLFENGVLTDKFKIRGIPTLLVLDAGQKEIDRIYDFQPIATLREFFTSIKTDATPIQELMVKAEQQKTNRLFLTTGKRLLSSGRAAEAVTFLSRVTPVPVELLSARVAAAKGVYQAKKEDSSAQATYSQSLREAIQAEPASSRSLSWRIELMPFVTDPAEKARIRTEGVTAADRMLSYPMELKTRLAGDLIGEFTGYEALLVASQRAELVSASEAPADEISKAWKKAAETGARLKIDARTPGPALRYLLTLTRAEMFKEADQLAEAWLKAEPGNVEVQRRRIKVLSGLGKFPQAIELGKSVLKNSYGQNEFWVVEALAKAYVGASQKAEARQLVEQYLGRSEMEWPSLKSSRKSLEELKAKL